MKKAESRTVGFGFLRASLMDNYPAPCVLEEAEIDDINIIWIIYTED